MFEDGNYVKHKKEGYEGIIDGQTSIKELFTGNKSAGLQYRIRLPNTDIRRVAPEEDLEGIDPLKSPNFNTLRLLTEGQKEKFQEVSFLGRAGYISSADRSSRREVLAKVVREESLLKVVSFLLRSLIFNRTGNPKRVAQSAKCLNEWASDVDWLMKHFKDADDFPVTNRLFEREKIVLKGRGFSWE
ncbi:MAG: hypothetical protein WCI27_05495 [Candidatus Omnitrophota bacterium]